MFHLNAEHPKTVIFRDNHAYFLETERILRKLGSSGQNEPEVDYYQLRPGDSVLAGSDGRDDILLFDTDGLMNEDENLFLSLVESSHGNLQEIHAALKAKGELTDDMSLLRLDYRHSD